MKLFRLLPVLLVLAFVMWGCKKSNDKVTEESGGPLTGNWEIYQSYSGMMPLTTYPPDNGMGVRFDGSHYKFYRNGQVVHEGVYQLMNDTEIDVRTCAPVQSASAEPNRIVYDSSFSYKVFYKVSGSTLKISSGCLASDGGWTIYKRKHSTQ